MYLIFFVIFGCSDENKVYKPEVGEGKYILTPEEVDAPKINGASVFGVHPNVPFMYTIPTTGERPIKFQVEDLPKGLMVNENSGHITGIIADTMDANYQVTLKAINVFGETEKLFTIKVGNTICLTPPLGWNSWNCWKTKVTQDNVIASAKAMIDKGLVNYGWSYINIDDAWQGERGGAFHAIQPDLEKFPNIKQMCDDIHRLGLKVGIYSSPWITTYAGFVGGSSNNEAGTWNKAVMGIKKDKTFKSIGSYYFGANDAKQWAEWGIDYLKYDWNPNDPESTIRMANALNNSGRDIVYSLSNTAPLEHAQLFGEQVNCFRTAGDLKDRWDQKGPHLNIREQWELHRAWMEQGVGSSPGHFPDPDMLVVGEVTTSGEEGKPVPSNLTADEQYAHISLWTLWASPLLIGCPIETLDDFTINLLTNAEILDVHQDALAVSGKTIYKDHGAEIIVKDLADGGKAFGLFNISEASQTITLDWKLARLEGVKDVRDVWRQKDIGSYKDSFSAIVPSHGVVFIRLK